MAMLLVFEMGLHYHEEAVAASAQTERPRPGPAGELLVSRLALTGRCFV
jgi:hypothetical protein